MPLAQRCRPAIPAARPLLPRVFCSVCLICTGSNVRPIFAQVKLVLIFSRTLLGRASGTRNNVTTTLPSDQRLPPSSALENGKVQRTIYESASLPPHRSQFVILQAPSLLEPTQMAGYFIYTLDGDAFSQLTTAPTHEQAAALARHIHERAAKSKSKVWSKDVDALTTAVKTRLAMADWYADLSDEDAELWDSVVFSLCGEVGEEIGIGFQCSDYESIYWDCAEETAEQGVELMQEPKFGSSGYRFFGELSHDFGYHRIYGIHDSAVVQELLTQLIKVEPYFTSLADDGEGSVREQFTQGLLAPVKYAAENGRVLFVQTDT
jgi:hypothetical protein